MARERMSEASWNAKTKRWCCRVMVHGKRRAFYSSIEGRRGKREAERKADQWIETGAISPKTKVCNLWEEYMAYDLKKRGKDNESHQQRCKFWRLYISPTVGQKRLESMKQIDWQECIDRPFRLSRDKGKPLSAKTLCGIRGALSAFQTYCTNIESPIPGLHNITIPEDAPVGTRTILQPEDIQKLFSEPVQDSFGFPRRVHYLHLWRFMLITGLRPGEAIGLMWDDITDDTVQIKRSVNKNGNITHGKNKNAQRSFLLPLDARKALNDQLDYLRGEGIHSQYIFPSPDGSVAAEPRVYRRWRAFCKSQGMTQCSLYEIRHTMISMNSDIPDALLKPMVGHSKSMDTRGTYSHEMQGDRERTAQMIGNSIQNILNLDAKKYAKPNPKQAVFGIFKAQQIGK